MLAHLSGRWRRGIDYLPLEFGALEKPSEEVVAIEGDMLASIR